MSDSLDNRILIFKSEKGPHVSVTLTDDSVWLTQKQMAELFDKNRKTITEHIQNIFSEKELIENLVCRKFQLTAKDGKAYHTKHYNLDVIISVGYRVKSIRGTQFRIWATNTLRQHLIDGYTQNTDRLLERKLELDVKESRAIFSQLIQTQQEDTAEHNEAIDLVSTYLGAATDQEALLLKAHLLTERFLINFIEQGCKNSSALNHTRLSYKQLLGLAQSQFENDTHNDLWELLNRLNSLRNTFAHTLDITESEVIIHRFLNLCTHKIEDLDKSSTLKQSLVHLCGFAFNTFHIADKGPSSEL